MATSYVNQFLGILKRFDAEATGIFATMHAGIAQEVMRAAGPDGKIPPAETRLVQFRAGQAVERQFVGPREDGTLAPFVVRNGDHFPLAPYPRILDTAIRDAVMWPVLQHREMMERWMSSTAIAQAQLARESPFSYVVEQNPLAHYEPPHTWVDPNGYRLSDRIWNTSNATRRRIDAYLEDSIRQGRSSLQMSRELEQFLLPNRTLRTRRPYGTDASYDAMRLARTEITRAHAQAAEVSASSNPFVEGVNVVLSGSHPKRDICDEAAAASPFPKNEIPFEYRIPLHPHCLCHYTYTMVPSPAETSRRLDRDIPTGRSRVGRFIGPLLASLFIDLLLGITTREIVR